MTALIFSIAALSLIACKDGEVEDTAVELVDADNDSYFDDEDCDDNDATAYPGAPEYCDGVDNNCDGEIDEAPVDGLEFFVDADGDGFGNDGDVVSACEVPEGAAEVGGDCNDDDVRFYPGATEDNCADPSDYNCDGSVGYADGDGDGWAACQECDDGAADINPAADETCDEVDNNCNGTIDEDSAIDAATWYLDADGDTYGSSKSAFERQACEQPEGYSDNNLDCDDLDPVVNPDTIWYADSDGDSYGSPDDSLQICAQPAGYVLDDQDCDDADAERNPDTIWFEDGDADGYGATTSITTSCEEPSGYADNATDCDDTDASASPGGTETCDLVDNDCNGVVDDDYATDASSWYADDDGDAFGDATDTGNSCTQPVGYVADNTDCDDASADVNPDAEEVCNDGIDNDCSPGIDFCELSLADADSTIGGSAASDQLGNRLASVPDMDGDGNDELLIAAHHESTNALQSGAAYLFLGPISSGAVDASTADVTFLGTGEKFRAGSGLIGDLDADGDGTGDIVVAALRANGSGNVRGEVYVMDGTSSWSGSYDLDTAASYTLSGEDNFDRVGSLVINGGDSNGDGQSELIAAARYDDEGGSDAGAIYMLDGVSSSGSFEDLYDAKISGSVAGGVLGGALASGDLDGDGDDDLIVGFSEDSSSSGSVGIFDSGYSGSLSYSDADSSITGGTASDELGSAVAVLPDLDGDGYAELLIGAPGEDSGANAAGATYLFFGPVTSGSATTADALFVGESVSDRSGAELATGGDFDGDGTDDFLVGASNYGGADNGAVYVVYGDSSVSGTVSLAAVGGRLAGAGSDDNAGSSVIFAGDTDGDASDELLIGSTNADVGGSASGAAYLLLGLDE
jgi:hypothetical protein